MPFEGLLEFDLKVYKSSDDFIGAFVYGPVNFNIFVL